MSARARKQRRATRAVLKYGLDARPTHKSRSGRTGKVHASQLKGLRAALKRRRNPSSSGLSEQGNGGVS